MRLKNNYLQFWFYLKSLFWQSELFQYKIPEAGSV